MAQAIRGICNTQQKIKNVTHVLFDMDGLLLDTELIYTQATNNVVQQYGKVYEWKHKLQIMGKLDVECAKMIVEMLDLPITWEEYMAQAKEQYKLLMPNAQLMPGAEKLVHHLSNFKIPFALATSSSQMSMELKIQNHKAFFDLFHHKVCGGSDPAVKEGKPNPDIFLVCASRFPDPPKPEDCLVFEDAPNGVAAAISAGMQCVMVPDPSIPDDMKKQATQVLTSLNDLKPELFGLPAYK